MFLTLLFMTTLAVSVPNLAAAGPPTTCPTAIAPVVTDPPVVDGSLSDPAWDQAAVLGPFVTMDGRPATHATTARVLRSGDTLFIGVTCPAPPGAKLICRQTLRDSDVWTDECVEVFLDPGLTLSQYRHLLVNVANVQRDEAGDKNMSPSYDPAWDGTWTSATTRTETGWFLELAIPFADLTLSPGRPALLGLNICRNDTSSGELTCWSPTLYGFHEPVRFGVLGLPVRLSDLDVSLRCDLQPPPSLGTSFLTVLVVNNSPTVAPLRGLCVAGGETARTETSVPGGDLPGLEDIWTTVPVTLKEPGNNALILVALDSQDNPVTILKFAIYISQVAAQTYGYRIAGGSELGVWWAESTYKIHRDKPMPSAIADDVSLSAAAHEYEAVQIVVRPHADVDVSLSVSDFRAGSGVIPAANFTLRQVEYVPVSTPSDSFGWPDDWPDPLPPLEGPVTCKAGRNQPFWLLAYVPPDTPPDTYRGQVTIRAGETELVVPVRLRVWGFALTPETHTRTAYGVWPDFGFLGVTDREQQRQVFDLYMQSCRDHRIAPYSPMAFYPMQIQTHGPMRKFSAGRMAVMVERGQSSPWKLLWDGRPVAWQATSQTHFEKEGSGWEGTGLGWPYIGTIESIMEVSASPTMHVLDVVGAYLGSAECARSYKLTFRLFIPAGDNWVGLQLMRMEGTDPHEVEVREYFNIPHTEFKAEQVANGDGFAAWSGQGIGFGMLCLGAPAGGLSIAQGGQSVTVSNAVTPFRIKQGQTHDGWGPLVVYFLTDRTSPEDLAARANELRARINPADPTAYTPLAPVTITREASDDYRFTYDFSQFDEGARRYLDEFHFNAFNFPCMPGDIGGFPQFSEEYKRLHKLMYGPVIAHLREKGWLDKAYSYWYDEPDEDAYPYVVEGMTVLRDSCPGLTRLLTEQPEPPLYGAVDLWCPVLHAYDPQRCHERQALGEQVWWYVCCGPRAPYPNNFIDHPAINHRIRFWMAEKYGVTGSLYWSTTYYGPLPDGSPRNPWTEGMTYTPDGKGTWGNGDGMLLYPACRERSDTPVLKGPVESIRWEMLRDGIEDREYFWTLRQEVARLRDLQPTATGDRAERIAQVLENATRALQSYDALVESLTKYTKNPLDLLRERDALAWAIELCRAVQ